MKPVHTVLLSLVFLSQLAIIGLLVHQRIQDARFAEEVRSGGIVPAVVKELYGFEGGGKPIPLPSAPVRAAGTVLVEVIGDGQVRVDGRVMPVDQLADAAAAGRWSEGPGVSIVSSETVGFTDSIAVFEAIRKAGVEKIGVATEPSSMRRLPPDGAPR